MNNQCLLLLSVVYLNIKYILRRNDCMNQMQFGKSWLTVYSPESKTQLEEAIFCTLENSHSRLAYTLAPFVFND